MKTVSVVINDSAYEKFVEIQKQKGFNNQSDALEFIIEEISKQFKSVGLAIPHNHRRLKVR